jgi:multiple sugar transport system substrate-binding protein
VRLSKAITAALCATFILPLAACGGSSSGADADSAPVTLNYWASNQGTSLADDKQVLAPELAKFTAQTGIKVNVEVVPWSDLLNRVLAATTSGQGPDVVNIGNTWSSSVQATGALLPFGNSQMSAIGGKDRFLAGRIAATGVAGQPPTAVPIYSEAYGLYYNKKQFAADGITSPPATWDELVADGKKLTTKDHWALAVEGASIPENIHTAFTLSQQQGGSFFDAAGKATFDTPQNVTAIGQFIDLMAKDKIVNPSDAEYGNGTEALRDYATGKVSMLMWQAASGSLNQFGMKPEDIGVAPVPLPASLPAGGKKVTSMVAGINLGVFKSSKHQDAALKFVKFMTSTPTQQSLNKTYGSLPSVTEAYSDPAFQTPTVQTFRGILNSSAAPLPQVPGESQFETLVGTVVKNLWADAASGKAITADYIKGKLAAAQQQVS